ncbi:MFS transporter [Neobacillus niacini]|uniref:MFS transporter n=1 Tax=Neobacillus niacini TaxID=86668 RepID=UPI00285E873F|nr:MFS transporter [Neobacillus niacini]MDR6998901.1 putative MFS family arabinose efflux permease [Neobacillus niacini]
MKKCQLKKDGSGSLRTFNPIRDKTIFLAVSFILWFSHFIYVSILSPYMESIGGKYTFIGIVLGSYGLMQLLFRLPIGISSDMRKVRKPFLIFGMMVSALSCFIFSVTDHLIWVLVARCLAGIAAATWVVFTVLYSSYFSDSEVHRAMSMISFIVVFAQLLGMGLSGYIVEEWGWHAPFWMGGGIAVIGVILSFFVFEPKDGIERNPIQLKDLTSVVKDPMLLKASSLSILAHSIIFSTMFGFIPAYALHIGFRAADLILVILSFMIPHAVATLYMGNILVPLMGKWGTLKISYLLASVFTFVVPFIHIKDLFYLVQVFNGFSLGIIFPLLLGMSIETIPHVKRATAMGAYQAIYATGIFAGPFFAGILNSRLGITAGFYFTAAIGLLAVILICFWERKNPFRTAVKIRNRLDL